MTIQQLAKDLNTEFPQRHKAVEAIMLGILTQEHVYLHGEPGTAKSSLARRALQQLPGQTFTATLSEQRPAEAVLGPYDVPALQQSQFIRKDEGYLTTARWALLDEIGKISPQLGHDLLAALNERLKHQVTNGRSEHKIPLEMAVTTSNEPMTSNDAKALWDRLLIRTDVKPLDSLHHLANTTTPKYTALKPATITSARKAVNNINLDTQAVYTTLDTLRNKLNQANLHFSDRRWHKSIHVMKAHAWLHGHNDVTTDALTALQYTLWTPDHSAEHILLETLANHAIASTKPKGGTTFAERKNNALEQAKTAHHILEITPP